MQKKCKKKSKIVFWSLCLPVGGDAGEVEDEVVVDVSERRLVEAPLSAVRPDRPRPGDRLTEVHVDRGARRRLDTLQLARRRNVEPLRVQMNVRSCKTGLGIVVF